MPEPKPNVSYKTKKRKAKIRRLIFYGFRYAFSIFTTWLEYDRWSGYNETNKS